MDNLSRKVAKKCRRDEEEVSIVLHSLIDVIFDDLKKYGMCKIPKIGTFIKKESKPHAIRNIQTGEMSLTKRAFRMGFKPCSSVKERLNKK